MYSTRVLEVHMLLASNLLVNKAFIYKVDPPGHWANYSQIGYTVESPNILGPRGAKIAS